MIYYHYVIYGSNTSRWHGYTPLHLHDEVTLIGSPSSLKEVTLKLGYSVTIVIAIQDIYSLNESCFGRTLKLYSSIRIC
jgi:hypothetical protein